MRCAKEIKSLTEVSAALGFKDDKLRKFVNTERLRIQKEKEKNVQIEREDKEREERQKERLNYRI